MTQTVPNLVGTPDTRQGKNWLFRLVAIALVLVIVYLAGRQLAPGPHATVTSTPTVTIRYLAKRQRDAVLLLSPAGETQIGDNAAPMHEGPAFLYRSAAFMMDRTPVTIAQFAAFVKDTGYKTDAERYGSGGVLDERQGAWVAVKGADWRSPTGPGKPAARANHPVTQVSWNDANA